MPDVSVVVPCYNAAATVARAVGSIRPCGLKVEVLLVDDGSSDDSVRLALSAPRPGVQLRLFRNTVNSGPGYSRNVALASARGRYLAFLDADDLWLPDKLARQVRFMEQGALAFSFHDYYVASRDSARRLQVHVAHCPDSARLPAFLYTRGYGMCLTSMIRRAALGPARFAEDRAVTTEDYPFFLDLLSRGVVGMRLAEALGVYTVAAHSRSSNKLRQALSVLRCNLRHEALGACAGAWYFGRYATGQVAARLLRGRRPLTGAQLAAIAHLLQESEGDRARLGGLASQRIEHAPQPDLERA